VTKVNNFIYRRGTARRRESLTVILVAVFSLCTTFELHRFTPSKDTTGDPHFKMLV